MYLILVEFSILAFYIFKFYYNGELNLKKEIKVVS